MTIRIRCAECQRKLKVPDEALGKKVQCPACGARFIGRLDTPPPPVPPLESPPPLQHPPLEMMAVSPFEETLAPEVPASAPAPPETTPPPSPFLNLELEEPALDAEAVEPAGLEAIEPLNVEDALAEDPLVVEEALAEEPIVVEEAATETTPVEGEALDPLVLDDEAADDVDVVEEADEDEQEADGKQQPRKKKSRGMLYGCLAGVGLIVVLGCGGVGFLAYRMYNSNSFSIFEGQPSQPGRKLPSASRPGP